MMRTITLAALGAAAWCGAALAQDPDMAAREEAGAGRDTITVLGRGRADAGMRAFRAGDYVSAEIEFDKNRRCVERREALDAFAADAARTGSVTAEVRGAAGGLATAQNPTGATAPDTRAGYDAAQPDDPDRTCYDLPFQLYMMGLSQLQLEKYDDAKHSFYRVIRLSNAEGVYDAYYRIGLLEVQDGDLQSAERHLATLEQLQRRCERRGARCGVTDDLNAAVASLSDMLARARGPG